VDLEFPDSLFYVPGSAALTNRKQDHVLFTNLLAPNIIRLYTVSANQLPFLGDSGTVATINFVVGNDTGTFPLNLSGGILYDASLQNIIRSTIDGEIYIQRRPTFQLAVTVEDDWNTVSVPGYNINGQGIDSWWSGRDQGTDVFIYNGGYITTTSTIPGEGYWMKHIGSNTYNTGDEWPANGIETVPHYPINALAGWNLKGGYEDTVQTAELTTFPPGLISGPIYGYYDGYIIVSELLPGIAYWIKLSEPGQIIFPEVLNKNFVSNVEYFKEGWGRIIITDAEGRSYTLYAVDGSIDLDIYELPPKPPARMFDIRFGSGRIAEDLINEEKIVEMSGVRYPVKIKAENMNLTLQYESGKVIDEYLSSGEEISISDGSVSKFKVRSGGLLTPNEYLLEQNYPNPFNPATTIKFSLPEQALVKVSIYNTLGQKVTELINNKLEAGYHSYEWDAGSLASGMYIYELRSDNFISIKKMILLK
jgi:hypothetical protein